MLERIAHRGPDGRGVLDLGPVVLGHVRLAILDLSDDAAQPMASHDGRHFLTYNGEVYNFNELRSRVLAAGVNLCSTGDTEVLLEHLRLFGVGDTLPRIEGFFAFALWDARDSVLTLARDRFGKKPLYWTLRSGGVHFASEQKALVDESTRPDSTTVSALLLGFPASRGRATVFQDIEAVEAGAIVEFHGGQTPHHRRWFSVHELVDAGLHADLDGASDREVCKVFEDGFRRSMHHRMVSDVPVASLVSGGVDSTLVTVVAAENDPPPSLYHADVVADTERPASEAVASHVGLNLRTVPVSDRSFVQNVARATWHNDAPLTYHLNAVPLLLVCDLARAHGEKVLLSGEGSDELFLGYPHIGLAAYLNSVRSVQHSARRLGTRIAPRVTEQVWPNVRDSHNVMLQDLLTRAEGLLVNSSAEQSGSHLNGRAETRAHAECISLVESHLPSLLHRNDRLGMAAGIENRFPFLGSEVTRLAINLPVRYKLRWNRRVMDRRHPFVVDKWIVRETAEARVSRELAARPKRGFPVRVQGRVSIKPAFLIDGFVSDHWRLDAAAVEQIFRRGTPTWLMRLALVEVWGRLFFGGVTVEEATESLAEHIRPSSSALETT